MGSVRSKRFAVAVSVDSLVIKAYSIVANDRESAIGKARDKMRNAVSSAGVFTYSATEVGSVVLGGIS